MGEKTETMMYYMMWIKTYFELFILWRMKQCGDCGTYKNNQIKDRNISILSMLLFKASHIDLPRGIKFLWLFLRMGEGHWIPQTQNVNTMDSDNLPKDSFSYISIRDGKPFSWIALQKNAMPL